MGRADWSARALDDLARQLDWLDARNPAAARALAAEVTRVVALAAEQPGIGFPLGRADLRVLLTRRSRHRIVYRPAASGIEIIRILHARQQA